MLSGLRRVVDFMRIFDEVVYESVYSLLCECGVFCNLICLGFFVIICYVLLKFVVSFFFFLLLEFVNEN